MTKESIIGNEKFLREWEDFQEEFAKNFKNHFTEGFIWVKNRAIEILSRYSDTDDEIERYKNI